MHPDRFRGRRGAEGFRQGLPTIFGIDAGFRKYLLSGEHPGVINVKYVTEIALFHNSTSVRAYTKPVMDCAIFMAIGNRIFHKDLTIKTLNTDCLVVR